MGDRTRAVTTVTADASRRAVPGPGPWARFASLEPGRWTVDHCAGLAGVAWLALGASWLILAYGFGWVLGSALAPEDAPGHATGVAIGTLGVVLAGLYAGGAFVAAAAGLRGAVAVLRARTRPTAVPRGNAVAVVCFTAPFVVVPVVGAIVGVVAWVAP